MRYFLSFPEVTKTLRATWHTSAPRKIQEAQTVLHGLAESVKDREINSEQLYFFSEQFEKIQNGTANVLDVENSARLLGLPVCNPHEDALSITCYFARVGKQDGDKARVILMDDRDLRILDDVYVDVTLFPASYREEGAGVAWVERNYSGMSIGRFEPASMSE